MNHWSGPRCSQPFGALLLAMACLGARAQTVAPPPELYLEVSVNGQASGAVVRFTQGGRGLRSSVQNLRDLGLDPALFGVAGQEEFDLDAVAGLGYTYDAQRQRVDLHLADTLRQPLLLQARAPRAASAGAVSPGLLLNYDVYAQLGNERRVAAVNEFRYFDARGAFSSSGNATLQGRRRSYVRYDTSWSRSDPATLASVQVGDFVSPSLGWTRSMRMAGIEWRKNFELRPDLLTYPVAALGGSAVVPSSVSLYVNGVQQFNAEVPGGPFLVDQIAGLNGAGQATIVTRDALGRSVSTSLPLYVDTRLLARGLTDYAFSLGVLRRDYSVRSFSYADSPAASGSLRHGWSDALTLEGHAEAGRGLVNAGAGGMLRLGQAGVLNAALSASSGASHGLQRSVGYQYVAPRFSIDAQSVRASRGYGDLGTTEGSAVSRVNDRVNLSLPLPAAQSVSLSYIHYRAPAGQPARVAALAYSRSVGHGAYFSVNGFQDIRNRQLRGVLATLSIALAGRVSVNASRGTQNGERSGNVTMSRAPDFDGGFGWATQKGTAGRQGFDRAQVQYLGNLGQLTASTQGGGGKRINALGLAGALVAMDRTVVAARHVGRGFALVATGLPNVPVLQENRPIGRTDRAGYLLVPDLIPYTNNVITIDTSELPADARVGAARMNVVPQRLAGVLAGFPVERFAAATIIVQRPDGEPLPAGTPVEVAGSQAASVVGYDGMLFVDGLRAQNRLILDRGGARCEVRFAYQPAAGGELPVIGPLKCFPLNGDK